MFEMEDYNGNDVPGKGHRNRLPAGRASFTLDGRLALRQLIETRIYCLFQSCFFGKERYNQY